MDKETKAKELFGLSYDELCDPDKKHVRNAINNKQLKMEKEFKEKVKKQAMKYAEDNDEAVFKTLTEKEFNLSDKRGQIRVGYNEDGIVFDGIYPEGDVKEFIKRQVERIDARLEYLSDLAGLMEAELQMAELRKIKEDLLKDAGDKLAGDKFTDKREKA